MFAVSKATRNQLADILGLPGDVLRVAPTGVPADFLDVAADPPADDLRLLFLGNLSHEKNPEAEKADENQPPKPAEKTPAELKAERERIERDNQRKQDEYNRLRSDGKKHVAELNARFADWYYIISNEVYQKIRLTRDELIKKKEKPAEGEQSKDGHPDIPSDAAFPAEILEQLKAQQKPEKK